MRIGRESCKVREKKVYAVFIGRRIKGLRNGRMSRCNAVLMLPAPWSRKFLQILPHPTAVKLQGGHCPPREHAESVEVFVGRCPAYSLFLR